ncbi:hypothetical protein LINGRAHAP2_LOCUS28500 [Linum grandiflorum]
MAFPSEHYITRSSSNNGGGGGGALRLSLALAAIFLFVYIIMGPRGNSSSLQDSSTSCQCDCDCADAADSKFLDLPSGERDPSLPSSDNLERVTVNDSINGSYADCGTNDPEIKQEVEKDRLALLSEEIVLQKLVANETLQRTKTLTTESGLVYSHYKREAEKCISQVETCEEARERAEAELREELKITASWEQRALELGWSSGSKRVH